MRFEFDKRVLDSDSRRLGVRSAFAAAGLWLVVLVAPALAGSNLLSNGEFSDFSVTPWEDDAKGSVYLSNLDHAGNLDSGSALIVDDNGSSLYSTVLRSECVRVQGGSPVTVGGYFKAGSSFPGGSTMRTRAFYYSDSTCSEGISSQWAVFVPVPSGWTSVATSGTAPTNAQGVKMEITAASGSQANLDLLADGLFVDAIGAASPEVHADGFESGDLSAWTVAP